MTDRDNLCPICLEELNESSKITTVKCGHIFHSSCIHKWLHLKKKNTNCPSCGEIIKINTNIYPKHLIIETIKKYLNQVKNAKGRNNKISCVEEVFIYLAKKEVNYFVVSDNEKLRKAIKLKLMELYTNDNLDKAKTWWKNIFNYDMPN